MQVPLTPRRIREHVPLGVVDRLPFIQGLLDRLIGAGLGLEDLQAYLAPLSDLRGQAFVDGAIEALGVRIAITDRYLANLPATGRCVIAANHPTGVLEMAMGCVLGRVRPDYRIVLNTLLLEIADNARDLAIPVPIFRTNRPGERDQTRARIQQALAREQALLFFPSGVVSGRGEGGRIQDGAWRPGFVHHALQAEAPIVPVHIDARNSRLFYRLRAYGRVGETLSQLLLFREFLDKRGTTFRVRVGRPIPPAVLGARQGGEGLDAKALAQQIRAQVYNLAA
jgi:putative hemolysin